MSRIFNTHLIQFITYFSSFLLLFFSFSNKTFLLAHFIIGIVFFFVLRKTLLQTLISLFLISFPFEVPIRFWEIIVTPPLFSGVPGSGYSIYLGLTLKTFFIIALFLLFLIRSNQKKTFVPINLGTISLLSLSLISLFNTAFFYIPDAITFYGTYRLWQAIFIFFIGQSLITASGKKIYFTTYLLALSLFSGILGTLQFINQRPLGRYIELTPSFSETGYNTGIDGPTQTRIAGFISHPVYFGSFISILIPITLGLTLLFLKQKRKKMALISAISLILCTITGLGTISRTVWINLFLTFILFYSELKPLIFRHRFTISPKIMPLFLLPLIPLILLNNTIVTRLKSIPLLLSQNGNASIRLELIKQSFEMIYNHPLVGVGPNRFTEELKNQYIPPNITGFIVVVHNTILIIFTEFGIPAGISFLLFLIYGFISTFNLTKNNLLYKGIWIGLVTFLISSQFHPLLNQDPTFELFMLLLGFLTLCQPQPS